MFTIFGSLSLDNDVQNYILSIPVALSNTTTPFLGCPYAITIDIVLPLGYDDHRRIDIVQIKVKLMFLVARVQESDSTSFACYSEENADKFN